jgi:hypothetical protein
VLYWFWSHLQLTQKKVQLLENAVFELRGMMAGRPEPNGGTATVGGGGPEPAYNDLTDDEGEAEWAEEGEEAEPAPAAPRLQVDKIVDTPDEQVGDEQAVAEAGDNSTDALQPGGRIQIPEADAESEERAISAEQFRTMFTADEGGQAPSASPAMSSSQSLEGMPVRDLRRLAEERGIKNAEAMKKKELLAALRAQAGTAATLDLTSMGVVVNKEEEVVEEVPVLD